MVIAFISLAYCASIFHRHRDHRDRDKGLYEDNKELPSEIKTIYISLVERRYSTIQNYFIYQIVNKVFGLTGVIYSILGLGLGLIEVSSAADAFSMKALCATVSFISIVCVIIALYLSPTRRVAEYINVWRLYDKKVSEMIGLLPTYSRIENVDIQATTSDSSTAESGSECNTAPHKVETSKIISEVSEFVFKIESSITSECE